MLESRLPYPGLRAFDREEADLFFGRDSAVDDMIDRLAGTRFLAVLGASGSGKSSLVKTGLLDGLELGLHPAGPNWRICTFTPGGGPFRNLAAALYEVQQQALDSAAPDVESGTAILEGFLRQGPRSLIRWVQDGYLPEGHNLLLLVDQFEELFRYGGYSEREDAEAFVKLLIESTSVEGVPIHCVLTMRSEFLGACALIPGLAETINAGAYLTPRMSRSNCREAIVGPARMSGVEIENALVNRLLNDLIRFAPWEGDEDADQAKQLARRADQLPVMQHLLNRLWQHASARSGESAVVLTGQDYEALGGLSGALDAHGAELLEKFDEDEKILVERIFRSLVDGTSPATATRRPLRFRDIVACTGADEEAIRRVIEAFRADDCNFLRPGPAVSLHDETIVDISHESLIRQWSVLSDWVTAEARAASLWRRVSTSAERYQRQEGDLLTGLDLANLSAWWDEENPQPSWTSRYSQDFEAVADFMQKSVHAQRERERRRQDRELRERKRLRIGLASVTVLAIAASLLAYWAIGAEDTAKQAKQKAAALLTEVTDDYLAAIDEGQKAPITQRYALIQERSEDIDDVVDSLEDDEQSVLLRAVWLTRTADMLLDAGWVREGAERTAALEDLLNENPQVFAASTGMAIHADALAAVARGYIDQGEYDRANAHLDTAEAVLGSIDDSGLPVLRSRSSVIYRRSEVALAEERYAEFLRSVDALGEIYDEAYEAARAASRQALSAEADAEIQLAESIEQVVSALSDSDREHARSVIELFVRAQMVAVATVHTVLASSLRDEVQLDKLVAEVDEAYRFYAAIEQEEATRRRALTAHIARTKADYFLDSVQDRARGLSHANDAVGIAVSLLKDDPADLSFRSLVVSAHVQRAQILSRQGETDDALADLKLARQVVFDTRLERSPGPLWQAHDRSVFFNQFRVQDDADTPHKGRRAAQRLKAAVDYVAQGGEQALTLFDADEVFLTWALVASGAVEEIPGDGAVPYLEWLLSVNSQARPEFEDDYGRRRHRAWSYSQALLVPTDIVGEETWKTWYEQARANGIVDVVTAQESMFGLAAFRNMPVPLARHIPAEQAFLVRQTIEELGGLDKANEAQALEVMKRAIAELQVPGEPGDAQLAYTYLVNTIAAELNEFSSAEDSLPDRLEVLGAAIAANEAVAESSNESMLMLNYLVGTRADALQELGETGKAIAEYSDALHLAIDAFEANSSNESNLRNAIVYARKVIEMTTEDGSASTETTSRLDRLFRDVLIVDSNKRLLADSQSHVRGLKRSIEARQEGQSAIASFRLASYRKFLAQILAGMDADGETGGAPDDAVVEAVESVASLSGETQAETTVTKLAATDLRQLYSGSDIGESEHLNWSYEPLFPGPWRTVFDEERGELLDRFPDTTRVGAEYVRAMTLPFYENGRLVEVEVALRGGQIGVQTYLLFPDAIYSLNGTSPAIHEANAKAPVLLETTDQAAAYLRFFSTYVNGDGGAFLIVDNGNEINWDPTADPEEIEAISRRIRPLVAWPDEERERHWLASATVQYSGAIFAALFHLQPTGMVEMLEDRPLAADLPISNIKISNRSAGNIGASAEQGDNGQAGSGGSAIDLEDLGMIRVSSFEDEVDAVLETLNESGPEGMDHVLAEYAFYLRDDIYLATHEDAERRLNSFAYDLLEHEVRLDDARKLASLAHERSPDNPNIKGTYGWALVKNGELDDGLEMLLEAGKLFDADPGSDDVMFQFHAHLGHAYRVTGQPDLARESLEKALAYDVPGDWLDFVKSELAML